MLFFVAAILFSIFGLIGFVFQLLIILSNKERFKSLQRYFLKIAVSIDQMGNVVCSGLFNAVLRKGNGYKFGNEDETISSVIGKNKKTGTLTKTGQTLAFILNVIDKNHCISSIEIDEISPK